MFDIGKKRVVQGYTCFDPFKKIIQMQRERQPEFSHIEVDIEIGLDPFNDLINKAFRLI